MAGPIELCMTDATGNGIIDGRFWGTIGHSILGGRMEIRVRSVMEMVNKGVAAAKARGAQIKYLYINGHGWSGNQGVGCGESIDVTGGTQSLQIEDVMAA